MRQGVSIQEGATGVMDTVIVFRVLKLLTTKWVDQAAYAEGLIDEKGKRIKSVKKPKDKNNYTYLHRLIFNLKRILELLPFGKTRLASYAAALALIKEGYGVDTPYLEESFYKHLKLTGQHTHLLEDYKETNNTLSEGHTYTLRTSIYNDDDNIGLRGDIVSVLGLTDRVMGVNIYKVYNKSQDQIQLITGQDVK